MITIENIASELAPSFWKDKNGQVMHLRDISEMAFKAGVEFAQRWISVEDELPEEGKYVLLKYESGIYLGGIDGNMFFEDTGTKDDETPTHWRPIEVK